jgi:hypothetical protein
VWLVSSKLQQNCRFLVYLFDHGYSTQVLKLLSRIFKRRVLCFVSDAEKPNYGQGTLMAVPLLAKGAESGTAWNAVLDSSSENVIKVKVPD